LGKKRRKEERKTLSGGWVNLLLLYVSWATFIVNKNQCLKKALFQRDVNLANLKCSKQKKKKRKKKEKKGGVAIDLICISIGDFNARTND